MNNTFYALLFRQKYITRWGLMRNFSEENLREHSADTAVLAHALAEIGNAHFGKHYDTARVALTALYHDASEVITGDLPTPVKYYNDAIRDNYHAMEDNAVTALLSKLPPSLRHAYMPLLLSDDPEVCLLVKAADKLSAYIKCIEEEKSGNTEFRQAKLSTAAAMKKLGSPELAWFCKNVLPTFSLTLDEL